MDPPQRINRPPLSRQEYLHYHPNNPRSYANITRQANNNPHNHEEMEEIRGILTTLQKEIIALKMHLKDIDTRLDAMEEFCAEKQRESTDDEMEEDNTSESNEITPTATNRAASKSIRETQTLLGDRLDSVSSAVVQMIKTITNKKTSPQRISVTINKPSIQ